MSAADTLPCKGSPINTPNSRLSLMLHQPSSMDGQQSSHPFGAHIAVFEPHLADSLLNTTPAHTAAPVEPSTTSHDALVKDESEHGLPVHNPLLMYSDELLLPLAPISNLPATYPTALIPLALANQQQNYHQHIHALAQNHLPYSAAHLNGSTPLAVAAMQPWDPHQSHSTGVSSPNTNRNHTFGHSHGMVHPGANMTGAVPSQHSHMAAAGLSQNNSTTGYASGAFFDNTNSALASTQVDYAQQLKQLQQLNHYQQSQQQQLQQHQLHLQQLQQQQQGAYYQQLAAMQGQSNPATSSTNMNHQNYADLQQLMAMGAYQQPYVPQFHPSNFASIPSSAKRSKLSADGTPRRPTTASGPRTLSALANAGESLYEATYSNVPVYELAVGDNSVMRRREDSWINATHVLKVAGIEKGRRTKILEKEVHHEMHEKIQGGYGKYQGTWIPLDRAKMLAAQFGVDDIIAPILDIV
ncbi:hypothetical protein BDV3_000937 [Batrachochytrium dendrobatidis]|uniref:HTH APSES-type domain-containing protein n=2 Tax=Batrachochytrium dendrobatidis TaxID=109871 RepID=A0A177W851_BATDL|nr:transcriptional regulator swi6 [Batrachochytrium dendrobatidis]OAJ36288.1 hypothetical protein BDEG_20480 [Batrachochytrium dendrobatidis JEL423]